MIQAEKVDRNCYYVRVGGEYGEYGIWMCEDSWWFGKLADKRQCNGTFHASTNSKPNVRVQNYSLHWKWVEGGSDVDVKFNCVDLCL